MNQNNFLEFIDSKTLFYDKIDYEVINKAWRILENHVKIPYIIHIIGTNGKGTTGRFIASFLYQNSKKTLHYTSPHIEKFNERIWVNNRLIKDEELQNTHQFFLSIFPSNIIEQLTYFEYTTLMAIYLSSGFDYLVLEAGLGGEFDATNVVDNNLTVIPSIGLDHMDFLGNTIEKIASTKLRSCDDKYIFGIDTPQEVLNLKKTLLKTKKEITINRQLLLVDQEKLPQYLQNNLVLALSVLDYLHLYSKDLKIDLIEGRFEKFRKNITIDVGHNPLAASMVQKELKTKKINLIYNSYKDKDYKEILSILKNNIAKVYVIECDDERMEDKFIMLEYIKTLNLECDFFSQGILNTKDEFLVFGSFKVVETFKKMVINEK